MSEKETGVIKIEGFTKETISAILEYIYTGKCPNLSEFSASIFYAADQFILSELKHMCAMKMAEKLSFDNVVETLKLADLYSEEELKSKCLEMISCQRKKFEMDNFTGLNSDLLDEINSILLK